MTTPSRKPTTVASIALMELRITFLSGGVAGEANTTWLPWFGRLQPLRSPWSKGGIGLPGQIALPGQLLLLAGLKADLSIQVADLLFVRFDLCLNRRAGHGKVHHVAQALQLQQVLRILYRLLDERVVFRGSHAQT